MAANDIMDQDEWWNDQQHRRWLVVATDVELNPSPDITPRGMAVAVIPIVLVAILGIILKLGNVRTLLVASARCVIQLLLLGLILSSIFGNNEPYVVLPYLLFMVLFATWEASVKPKYRYRGMRWHMFLSIMISLIFSLALITLGVLQPNPIWDAQVLIPVGGMLLGSCVSALSLGMDRFLLSLCSGSTTHGSPTLQTYLACGATRWEAALPSVRQAMETGLTPNLNQMSVMGLVSIPGMFTGQILAGTPPWIAAKYQIVIMFFVCSNSIFILFLTMVQSIYRWPLFDRRPMYYHCFRGDLVTERKGGKPKDVLLSTLSTLAEWVDWVHSKWSNTNKNKQKKNDTAASSGKDEIPSHDDIGVGGGRGPLGTEPESTQELVDAAAGKDGGGPGLTKALGPAAISIIPSRLVGDYHPTTTTTTVPCPPTLATTPTELYDRKPLLTVRDGRLSHGGRILLDGINLDLHEREIMVVTGPSGTGKSTLLRALALLQPLDRGTAGSTGTSGGVVSFRGRPVPLKGATEWRSEVLYVRQSGGHGLSGTPRDVLGKMCDLDVQSRRLPTDRNVVMDRFASYLDTLTLSTDMMDQRWDNMSGGEAQRVYMCMLLALNPAVLLLDEPTSACDEQNAKKVERLIVSSGMAVVWISHDPAQIERLKELDQTSLLQLSTTNESSPSNIGDL